MSNIIGLNVANTITIWIMAALGLALVGIVSATINRQNGAS